MSGLTPNILTTGEGRLLSVNFIPRKKFVLAFSSVPAHQKRNISLKGNGKILSQH